MIARHGERADHTIRNVALVLAVIAVLGLWAARDHAQKQATIRASAALSAAANAAAKQRAIESQKRRRENASRRSRKDSYYSPPAAAPREELSAPVQSPPVDRVAEDRQVREQAEARLRAEQLRFAALTDQGRQTSQARSSTPPQASQSRCAQAKAARDAAYRTMGNNRKFDTIRQWDDFVYEACKSS